MSELDHINAELIRLLEDDGRTSYADLASRLGVSTGTVRNRLQKLLDQRVIQITAYANPNRDVAMRAFIGFSVEARRLKSVAQELIQLPAIRYAAISTGDFDIVALAEFTSKSDMLAFLVGPVGEIDGVKSIQSFVLLAVLKSIGKIIEPLEPESEDHGPRSE